MSRAWIAADRDARVVGALRDVGVEPGARWRTPEAFSGGQR